MGQPAHLSQPATAGGTLQGTWALVTSGSTGLAAGGTLDTSDLGLPGNAKIIYLPVVTIDTPAGANISVSGGNVGAAPPNAAIHYAFFWSGAALTLRIRSGATTPTVVVNYAVYSVTVP
jgi:hypothetical protein